MTDHIDATLLVKREAALQRFEQHQRARSEYAAAYRKRIDDLRQLLARLNTLESRL